MTKLTRLFATCVLVASISTVALADGEGGDTHGPPAAPPAPECTTDPSSASASEPVQDSPVDIVVSAENMLTTWLVTSIF